MQSAREQVAFLIGIDDTDDLESRGTGFHARELGRRLAEAGEAVVTGITRHQLLVDPRIRYTSHNSAACLALRARPEAVSALTARCRDFLQAESAGGADAGLCIASLAAAGAAIQAFGQRAKQEVLQRGEAERLAGNLVLEGLTGDGGGMIGALAAIGLRAGGGDGRFLWLPGLREAANRRYRLAELGAAVCIEGAQTSDGTPVEQDDALIDLGPWPRPVLLGGRAILLVERASGDEPNAWRAASRDLVKRH